MLFLPRAPDCRSPQEGARSEPARCGRLGFWGVLRPSLCLCFLATVLACSPTRQVSSSGFGAFEVSLAAWSDGLALAWYDTRQGNAEVYVRLLDRDGRSASPELRVTNTRAESYEADIAALDEAFAIAWYEKSADDELRAELGVWARDGTPRWTQPIAVGSGSSRNPVLRHFGDALFCAWIEVDAEGREFVWGAWWGVDGRRRVDPVRLGAASATTRNLNAAVTDRGEVWVVFDAQAGTKTEELFLAKLADGETDLTQLSADDGFPSKYPDVAFDGSHVAITWFDGRDGNREVYLATGSAAAWGLPIETHAHRVTMTPGESIGAYLAWNSERIGLAWSDDTTGNFEVYFQSFDEAGRPLDEARSLTHSPTDSLIPAIEPWGEGFALAWNEFVRGGAGVHAEDTRSEVVFTTVR